VRQIVLIDGDEFARLIVREKVGTRVQATIEVQGLDEGVFQA
jgi:restriction endonuclease Mrr